MLKLLLSPELGARPQEAGWLPVHCKHKATGLREREEEHRVVSYVSAEISGATAGIPESRSSAR